MASSTPPYRRATAPATSAAEPLHLTAGDQDYLAGTADALFNTASADYQSDRVDVDPATNFGRYLVSYAFRGLVAESLQHRTPQEAQSDPDHALKLVRTAKYRAMCLRNIGLRATAERELVAVAQHQAALRDPDRSETCIALSNLYLSAQMSRQATEAASYAVGAAYQDSFTSRVREALAEAQTNTTDARTPDAICRDLDLRIGHWFPQPSEQLMENALRQLDTATEALIEDTLHDNPQQASQERENLIALSKRFLGASHNATLTRVAVLSNNNARQWMQAGYWSTAHVEMARAVAAGEAAGLDGGTLQFLAQRREACRSELARTRAEPAGE